MTQGAERDVRDEAGEPHQVAGGMAHRQQPQEGRHPHGLVTYTFLVSFATTPYEVSAFNVIHVTCLMNTNEHSCSIDF